MSNPDVIEVQLPASPSVIEVEGGSGLAVLAALNREMIRVDDMAGVDDDAKIAAAISLAAPSGATVMFSDRTYTISNFHRFDGCFFRGVPSSTKILCQAAAAGIALGPVIGVPGNYGGVCKSGGLILDGNAISTSGFEMNLVGAEVSTMSLYNFAGDTDAFKILGQNCDIHNVSAAGSGLGFDFVFDNGAGGNTLSNFNALGWRQVDFRQTVNSFPYTYAVPQDNVLDHGVFDNYVVGSGDGYSIRHAAGVWNVLRDCNIFHRNAPALIRFENNTGGWTGAGYYNGRLQITGRTELTSNGTAADQSGVWADFVTAGNAGGMSGDVAMNVQGELVFAGLDRCFKWGSTTPATFLSAELTTYPASIPVWVPDGTGAAASPGGLLVINGYVGLGREPDLVSPYQFRMTGRMAADKGFIAEAGNVGQVFAGELTGTVATQINNAGGYTLPTGTIVVDSTTGFAAAGLIKVGNQTVSYTGKTATSFTGCTGGSGAVADNTAVSNPAAGLLLGPAYDVGLYRVAANRLATASFFTAFSGIDTDGQKHTHLGDGVASTDGVNKGQLDTKEALANKDTDGTLAANSDAKYASQKAVKTYIDGRLAAADAMIYKGVLDCSGNPNYPAADAGWTYKVSVAGKIGGASGPNVEVGDMLLCLVDGTAAGTQAAVGASWDVIQVNIDGAVVGPATSTGGNLPSFSGSTGKVIADSGVAISTDGTLASNSDAKTPTEKATVTYVTTHAGLLIPKSLVDAKGDLFVGTADNTVARKAVGADFKALMADASQSDGLRWGPEAWQAPALANSWVNFGSGYDTVGYRRENGVVRLKGLVTGGTVVTIFTLPAGYRPPAAKIFAIPHPVQPYSTTVGVNAAGAVDVYTTGNAWYALEGITFGV